VELARDLDGIEGRDAVDGLVTVNGDACGEGRLRSPAHR
jgi:hypothetical protein